MSLFCACLWLLLGVWKLKLYKIKATIIWWHSISLRPVTIYLILSQNKDKTEINWRQQKKKRKGKRNLLARCDHFWLCCLFTHNSPPKTPATATLIWNLFQLQQKMHLTFNSYWCLFSLLFLFVLSYPYFIWFLSFFCFVNHYTPLCLRSKIFIGKFFNF